MTINRINAKYPFEDIRGFIVKRQWLLRLRNPLDYMITEQEYEPLKARQLKIDNPRAIRLRAFIEGWITAKE